jgi:hypothetical protein
MDANPTPSSSTTPPRPNTDAFRQAGIAAALIFGIALATLLIVMGKPASSYGAGQAVGRLLMPAILGALGTGWIARHSPRRWPFWLYVLCTSGFYVALHLLSAIGRMRH